MLEIEIKKICELVLLEWVAEHPLLQVDVGFTMTFGKQVAEWVDEITKERIEKLERKLEQVKLELNIIQGKTEIALDVIRRV